MSRVAVNGVRLEARIAGSGMPLLLLHGFTGRGSSWSPHLSAFQASHRTIVVDLLGHGRSDAPADPARYALERQAADLVGLLRTLGAPAADVLGYSMGARLALRLALDHPTAVGRLVIESPSGGIADQVERSRRRTEDNALAGTIERDGVSAFIDRWEQLPIFAGQAVLSPTAKRRLRRERTGHRAAGLASSLRGAGQGAMEPLHSRLGELRSPVLVIAGSDDPAGRRRAAAIAAGVRGATLAIVEGAGHTPHLERPDAFRSLVVAFLVDRPDRPSH